MLYHRITVNRGRDDDVGDIAVGNVTGNGDHVVIRHACQRTLRRQPQWQQADQRDDWGVLAS